MGNKTRNTGNLVSDSNIFVNISNDFVGIGSTQPTTKLDISGTVTASSFSGDGTSLSGIATLAVTNSLQSQINSLGTNLNIIGFYNAEVGVVTSLTVVGDTREYVSVGNTLPNVGINTGDYFIISTGGTNVGVASFISLGISTAYPGDWIVGVGNSEWNILSYSQQVIAPRATNADFADTLQADSNVNTTGILTASSFVKSGGTSSQFLKADGSVDSSVYATQSYVGLATVGLASVSYVDSAVAGVSAGSTQNVRTNSLTVVGVSTFTGNIDANGDLDVDGHTELDNLNVSGVSTFSGAISGSTATFTTGSFTGDLTADGTLTCGSITNVDSIGVITARSIVNAESGVTVGAGLSVVGVSTFNNDVFVGSGITIRASSGIVSATTFYGDLVGDVTGSITDATNLTGGYANASQLNVTGIATISAGRIQADASSNLRFGNLPAGSGSSRNIAIGDQVLNSLSGGSGRNIGIGELAYYDTTEGQYNIGIGIQAGQKITSGSYNVIIGGYNGQTGLDLRTSSNNVVIADGQGNIRQYINSSGNVGIKTTTASEALTVTGIVSATSFYGTLNASQLTGVLPAIDGSNLFGVTASGAGVEIRDDGTTVGTAATIDFGSNIDVSFGSGIATVSTSLVGYATETYVDNAISDFITISALDGYATENYVSTASVAFASTAGIASALTETVYVNTTGIITAASFYGSGANLTSIPSSQLSGALPAIDGSALLNVNATGEGIVVEDNAVNVGSARTVNFGTGLDVTYSSSGIATINASGGSLQSRTIVSGSTTSISDLGIGNTDITGFKSYALMKVGLSTTGWLRLYTDSTSRANDISRSVGEDPSPGSGVIAEVVTTGISTTQIISPFVIGGNLDNPADTTIYASIKNLSGSTQSITANLTILQLEA